LGKRLLAHFGEKGLCHLIDPLSFGDFDGKTPMTLKHFALEN